MAVFVLVHGSWHDGAAWQGVIRDLESMGHRAFAPTVAGSGKGASRNVTHAQCTESIVDFINAKSLSNFVLVGHSFGGTYISKVAEAIPEKIRRLVFQNAFIVRDGHSVLDESPLPRPRYSNTWLWNRQTTPFFCRSQSGETHLLMMVTWKWPSVPARYFRLNLFSPRRISWT